MLVSGTGLDCDMHLLIMITGFVQIGALNEVHHLWQFPDLEERRGRREESWSVSG